jgi:3-hydroxymyristoyl/3-hydroxydecanoyl-(acyl carrier protein) dehydratase
MPDLDDLIAGAIRRGRKQPLYAPADADRVELGRSAIESRIPHREPFLFVDRIDAIARDGHAIAGRRRLDPGDPLFRGHFPGDPIFPGALQVEAIGQLALCLWARSGGVRALKIHHAAFFEAIRPGAELVLLATVLESNDYTGVCAGQVLVGSTICCVAVMEVYFVEA